MAKYVRLDTLSYRESAGTPDARTIYYNYPTSGDCAVLSRHDNLAADSSGTTNFAPDAYFGVWGDACVQVSPAARARRKENSIVSRNIKSGLPRKRSKK